MQTTPQQRIVECLRGELEHVTTLSRDQRDALIEGFTVLDAPHSGHVQYRLTRVDPEMERRSDVAGAVSRAIHAAGYYVAGEE